MSLRPLLVRSGSPQEPPAVDVQHRAVYEAARVAREEQHRTSDLCRRAVAAERRLAAILLYFLQRAELLVMPRLDDARYDGVRADGQVSFELWVQARIPFTTFPCTSVRR